MRDRREKHGDPSMRYLGKELGSDAAVDLFLDDAGMKVRFLGGIEQLKRDQQFDSSARLEDGRFASLIGCVQLTCGQRGQDPETSPWYSEATPNLVLLGDDVWPEERRVRQLRFSFTDAVTALHYGDHVGDGVGKDTPDNHIATSIPTHIDADKLVILCVRSAGYTVICELLMSGSFSRLEPNLVFAPFVKVESDKPRTITEIHRFASQVLTFFEISLGTRSRMYDIRISEHTSAEQLAMLRDDLGSPAFHDVRLHYGNWEPSNVFLHPGYLVFPVYDRADREQTALALTNWLDRLTEWESTYALASFYLGRTGVFDRDRLLRATAWFESLPARDIVSNVTANQLAVITAAAQDSATAAQRGDLTQRIAGLLSNLSQKSLRRQLLDVVAALRSKFGESLVPKRLETELANAAALRSRASHGRLAFGDNDAEAIISATRALELVCLLSTVADLIDADDARQRIGCHHPLAGYRFSQ